MKNRILRKFWRETKGWDAVPRHAVEQFVAGSDEVEDPTKNEPTAAPKEFPSLTDAEIKAEAQKLVDALASAADER